VTAAAIETVGIYLTEDERRLLTALASDLECKGAFAPEAQIYAATRDALRKLMHLPAADRVSAEVGLVVLSASERCVLQRMRDHAARKIDEWRGWPTQKMYDDQLAVLDRLLGATL
jgi:hypothetical protein